MGLNGHIVAVQEVQTPQPVQAKQETAVCAPVAQARMEAREIATALE